MCAWCPSALSLSLSLIFHAKHTHTQTVQIHTLTHIYIHNTHTFRYCWFNLDETKKMCVGKQINCSSHNFKRILTSSLFCLAAVDVWPLGNLACIFILKLALSEREAENHANESFFQKSNIWSTWSSVSFLKNFKYSKKRCVASGKAYEPNIKWKRVFLH